MNGQYNSLKISNSSENEAVIEVYGVIGYQGWNKADDENTTRQMAAELDKVKNLKAESITVKINSLGGDVNHALAIHDLLADHCATVTTQINGLCASAATIIAMAGTVRKMSKNALFLVHKCSANPGRVNENRLLEELESQRTVNQRILTIYADSCSKDVKELLEANHGNGKWITAQQALDYGFITDIYNETGKAACISKETFSLSALPELPTEYADFLIEDAQNPSYSFKEQAPQSFFDAIREFFNRTQTTSTQNSLTMKKLFPFLAIAIALGDDAYNKDKGHLLSDEQLQNIEKQLKDAAELKTANQKLTEEKSTLENTVATLTKEKNDLKNIVDKLPGEKPDVNGKDASGTADNSFSDWRKQNAYYKSISEEL